MEESTAIESSLERLAVRKGLHAESCQGPYSVQDIILSLINCTYAGNESSLRAAAVVLAVVPTHMCMPYVCCMHKHGVAWRLARGERRHALSFAFHFTGQHQAFGSEVMPYLLWPQISVAAWRWRSFQLANSSSSRNR